MSAFWRGIELASRYQTPQEVEAFVKRIGRSTALLQTQHLPEIAEQLAYVPCCGQVAESPAS